MTDPFYGLSADAVRFAAGLLSAFAPPPDISPSDWAEQHIVLTSAFSAEPGNLRIARTPWIEEPLNLVADSVTDLIVVTGAAQTSKTTLSLVAAGYIADLRPTSILHVTPNEALSDTFSSRFNDLIASSATLAAKFDTPRRTGAKNNTSTKTFTGGVLSLAAASSPSGLSARPAKIVIADEVDRFGILRKEGDALKLAQARQATFFGRKLFAISTPTTVQGSRIEQLYAETDQNVWACPCPECGAEHVPAWENVAWTPGAAETAHYVQPCCGVILNDAKRWAMGAAGRWTPTAKGKPGARGYRFNGLCSPWITLQLLAIEFEAAKSRASLLQPFYNTRLGLPYEAETGEGVDADHVKALAEDYPGDVVPASAALITAGIDVQGGWLAVQVIAWGDGDEGVCLQWHEVQGDVKNPETWRKVETILLQKFKHASGADLTIEAVAIDSGYETQSVMEFALKSQARGRRWFATKGMAGAGRPLWKRGGDISRSMAKLWIVGVDEGKAQIMGGLAQAEAGPGKIHTRIAFPDHWFAWAVAEECVTTETATGDKRAWQMKRGQRRNEALDCLVLALAARYSFEPNIPARLERLATTGSLRAAPSQSIQELAAMAAALSKGTPVHV